MSYCRFSDADVYLFPGFNGFQCCMCGLSEQDPPPTIYPAVMIAHIAEHRAAGHYVPKGVEAEIQRDADNDTYGWREVKP